MPMPMPTLTAKPKMFPKSVHGVDVQRVQAYGNHDLNTPSYLDIGHYSEKGHGLWYHDGQKLHTRTFTGDFDGEDDHRGVFGSKSASRPTGRFDHKTGQLSAAYVHGIPHEENIKALRDAAAHFKKFGAHTAYVYESTEDNDSLPPEPGTTPIPAGHVRLYHQAQEKHIPSIRKHGILNANAKGIEGPKAIYATEQPFYGPATSRPTVEFHVPKEEFLAPQNVRSDVKPHQIISIHQKWHGRARYILNNPKVHAETLAGKNDDLMDDPEYGPAIKHVKGRAKVSESAEDNEADDLTAKAQKHFGVTSNPAEAGYITRDGKMLDLTGRHYSSGYANNKPLPGKPDYLAGHRNVDHRELPSHLKGGKSGTEGMLNFMDKSGAVRFSHTAGVVHIRKPVTPAQQQTLTRHLHRHDVDMVADRQGHPDFYRSAGSVSAHQLHGMLN